MLMHFCDAKAYTVGDTGTANATTRLQNAYRQVRESMVSSPSPLIAAL